MTDGQSAGFHGLLISLENRRLRFVVWIRSHNKDINRSPIVAMPVIVQLLDFCYRSTVDLCMLSSTTHSKILE